MNIKWDGIFAALEQWREKERASDPSVSAVAASFRRDPWAVLVSTILSLRTKDEVTLAASERLLKRVPSSAKTRLMEESEIARLIYPVGFYRNKAASIKNISFLLLERFNDKVPPRMEDLLALPGVGRKTANLVLNEAFDIDAVCVDIHVHRISNRCGWLSSETPEETEMILRKILPKKYWKRINYLLVLYGQKLCRPVSPFCSSCVIKKYCDQNGVTRSR